jgi:hypothetical protein
MKPELRQEGKKLLRDVTRLLERQNQAAGRITPRHVFQAQAAEEAGLVRQYRDWQRRAARV